MFERLPAELKLKVLESIEDFPTLHDLSLASRPYYLAYMLDRDTILTRLTIRQLESKDIDIFNAASFVQLSFRDNAHPGEAVISALTTYWDQLLNRQPIRFTIDQCCALLKVTDAVSWHFYIENGDIETYVTHNIDEERATPILTCSKPDIGTKFRHGSTFYARSVPRKCRLVYSGFRAHLAIIYVSGWNNYVSISSGFRFGPSLDLNNILASPESGWAHLFLDAEEEMRES